MLDLLRCLCTKNLIEISLDVSVTKQTLDVVFFPDNIIPFVLQRELSGIG